MYSIYGNIYHQYTPNVSIYTIHGSYGNSHFQLALFSWHGGTLKNLPGASHNFGRSLGTRAMLEMAPRVTAVHVWLIGAVHVWRIWMDLRFHPRGADHVEPSPVGWYMRFCSEMIQPVPSSFIGFSEDDPKGFKRTTIAMFPIMFPQGFRMFQGNSAAPPPPYLWWSMANKKIDTNSCSCRRLFD